MHPTVELKIDGITAILHGRYIHQADHIDLYTNGDLGKPPYYRIEHNTHEENVSSRDPICLALLEVPVGVRLVAWSKSGYLLDIVLLSSGEREEFTYIFVHPEELDPVLSAYVLARREESDS